MEHILTVKQPRVILCHKNLDYIGEIYPVTDFKATFAFEDVNEVTFTTYYEHDGIINPVWDAIQNLRVICIPDYEEHNRYFEIEIDEQQSDSYKKTIIAQDLCACELAQLGLTIEVNTDIDLEAQDYAPTVIYDENDTAHSLLHRILHDKAPHYSIGHVDASLCNLQRTFSVNSTIDDFLRQDLAQEIDAYVAYDTSTRTINLYDLKCCCSNCGERYDAHMHQSCPNCHTSNSEQTSLGYGHYTGIIASTKNLTDQVTVEASKGEIKNTFRIIGGDDLITNYVQAVNPNGSNYITNFSALQVDDMSTSLQDALVQYKILLESYEQEYYDLMNDIFDCIDEELVIQTKVPTSVTDTRTAQQQVTDLIAELTRVDPTTHEQFAIGLYSLSSSTSVSTINSAIVQWGKISLAPGYNLSVATGAISARDAQSKPTGWTGTIKIIDDEEDDSYTSTSFNVAVNDDAINYIKQKIDKALAYADIPENYDVQDYGITPLESLRDGIQSCLDILVEHGDSIYPRPEVPWSDQGYQLYQSYLTKYDQIVSELAVREAELAAVQARHDQYTQRQLEINTALNLENFLDPWLYEEMCSYRRDDDYQNDNYISDGLTTSEAMKKAQELLSTAASELLKANDNKYTLSANFYNLMLIDEFKPLQDKFDIGNWMYFEVGDIEDVNGKSSYKEVYSLRLVKVSIDYNAPEKLNVEFSNVEKVNSAITQIGDILKDAKSIASSYSANMKQMKNDSDIASTVKDWIDNGLDATNVLIKNAPDQDIVIDEHGILCRSYDDIAEDYEPLQMKIINSTIAVTDDNWNTTKTAFGKYVYQDPTTGDYVTAYGLIGETIVGRVFLGQQLKIVNESSTVTIDKDGITINNGAIDITGTYGRVTIDPNGELSLGNIFAFISRDGNSYITMQPNGNVTLSGIIYAMGGDIAGWTISQSEIYKNNIRVQANGSISATVDNVTKWSINNDGSASFSNATVSGTITGSTITGSTINGNTITGGSININNGVFSVDSNGNMTATSATITGSISGSTISGSTILSTTATLKDLIFYDDGKTSTSGLPYNYLGGSIKAPDGSIYLSFDTVNDVTTAINRFTVKNDAIVFGNFGFAFSDYLYGANEVVGMFANCYDLDAFISGQLNGRIGFSRYTDYSSERHPLIPNNSHEVISLIEPWIKCPQDPETSIYDWADGVWDGALANYGIDFYGNVTFYPWLNNPDYVPGLCSVKICGNVSTDHNYTGSADLYVDGDITYVGSIGPASSRKYKENIEPLEESEALKILDYDVVSYNYIGNELERHGVIAEDAELIRKYGVIYKKGVPDAFSYDDMIPDLMKLCQIMYSEIQSLKDELKELRNG